MDPSPLDFLFLFSAVFFEQHVLLVQAEIFVLHIFSRPLCDHLTLVVGHVCKTITADHSKAGHFFI